MLDMSEWIGLDNMQREREREKSRLECLIKFYDKARHMRKKTERWEISGKYLENENEIKSSLFRSEKEF